MCRLVILPELFRPPVFGLGTSSDFSGVDRVSSTKSATLLPRRPAVVGLYLRIPMDLPCLRCRSAAWRGEDVDALTGRDGDDRPLGVGTLAEAVPGAPLLARPVQGVHIGDPNLENCLHGDLDLGLVRLRGNQKRVL